MSTATITASPSLSLYSIESELTQLLDYRDSALQEGALPETLAAIDGQIEQYFAREVKKVDGIAHAIRVYAARKRRAS